MVKYILKILQIFKVCLIILGLYALKGLKMKNFYAMYDRTTLLFRWYLKSVNSKRTSFLKR